MPKQFKILELINDISSCAFYRNTLPVIYCMDELKEHNIELTNNFISGEFYDCQVWSRIPPATMFPYIRRCHNEGTKIIWDLDDELWNIPEWNPSHKFFEKAVCDYLEYYFEISTKIIASTENLAESISIRYKVDRDKIIVLENLISTSFYENVLNQRKDHGDTPFKIIWTGGHSHLKDVEPIKNIYNYYKNNNKVNIIMYGYSPDEFNAFSPLDMTIISWGNRKHYENTLCMLSPHVAIVPLEDIQFNRCKSAIKYYEMSFAGIPSIVSNATPYKNVVAHNENGFITTNCEEWVYYCEELRHNKNLWYSITENAMINVLENYSWNTPNRRRMAWLEFFKSIPSL